MNFNQSKLLHFEAKLSTLMYKTINPLLYMHKSN